MRDCPRCGRYCTCVYAQPKVEAKTHADMVQDEKDELRREIRWYESETKALIAMIADLRVRVRDLEQKAGRGT